eukprot:CCRYP_003823-RB/>CCRYP_003823-RB protein AED:0.48 eAED:0.48 QI:0/-1/0/1/-1/0/1/0/40
MKLAVHINASYLSKPKAHSMLGDTSFCHLMTKLHITMVPF